MKIKTFILTFLMMMSSPFLFGQHWTDPGDTGYNQSMSLFAQIFLDDDVQEGNYEVAAFYNDELLGVGQIVPLTGTTSNYHVHLNVQGNTTLNGIYFKFFNGTNEYVSSTEMSFTEGLKGSHSNYEPINFYSVAQIGDVVYPSLQKAINACKEGDNTIELLADNAEDVTIKQVEGVNVTIDGGTSRFVYSGTITIHGNARYQGAETLTFTNIDFTTDKAGHYFIDSNSTGSVERYAHNVTVDDCNFTATGAGENSAVAMRIRQGFDIAINGGTFTNLHSVLQAYGNAGINITGITSNCKNGISVGSSTNVVITNSEITATGATGYGVRAGENVTGPLTITDTKINAFIPVSVRKVTDDTNCEFTFTGNTMTASNTDGYWCVIGTSEYEANGSLPETAGKIIVNATEQDLAGVYGYSRVEVTFDDSTKKYFYMMEDAVPYNNADNYEGATIKLLSNCAGIGLRFWENGMTFDLNGKNYTITQAVGSSGTESQGFQIRPEVTGNVTIKNGTIDIKAGTNVKWMFNSYAADFVVKDVTIDGANMVTNTSEDYLLVVQNAGDQATFDNVTINNYTAKKVYLEGNTTFVAPQEFDNIEIPAGYVLNYADGKYTVVPGDVELQRNGVSQGRFASIAEAIAAAEANDVIVLLADITENVTVNKSVTIDGKAEGATANSKYTGKIIISGNVNVTINEVAFVDGFVEHTSSNNTGTITVKYCSFANGGYAITTSRIKSVTIENCEVTNQSLLYAKLSISDIVVKNVNISKGNYVAHIVYGSTAYFENVNATEMTGYGIQTQNYGAKTITINNCKFETPNYNSIAVRDDRTEAIDTFIFKGTNEMTSLRDTDKANYVLAEVDATLTAPEGYTVTTTVADHIVKYKDGKYIVVGANVQVKDGDEVKGTFATLAEAITAAQAGNTIVLLANITEDVTVNKNLTLDGAGKNYTGKITLNKVNFTAENVNFVKGNIYKNKDTGVGGTYTIKNCTFDGQSMNDYAVNLGGTSAIVIEGVTAKYYGYGFLQVPASNTSVSVKDVEISNVNYGLKIDYSGGVTLENVKAVASVAGVLNSNYGAKTITIKNSELSILGTWTRNNTTKTTYVFEGANSIDEFVIDAAIDNFKLADVNSTLTAPNNITVTTDVENSIVVYENGMYKVKPAVASITADDNTTTYYETLADAIAAIGEGDVVIELLADVTFDYNARDAYGTASTSSLTINGNGKTLTLNQKNSDWASFGLANADAKVVFNNMIIEKTGYGDTSGAWNTHAIIFSSNVEMTNVTVNNSMAVQDGATLNNVTINEANGYYGLWINGNGQSVTMNGGSINATNGGRGIKIADQYIDAPALVTLNVTGTTFNTAEKAAVLVSSKAGAVITASNVDITDVTEDNVNFAWVDEDWAAHYGKVTVTGGTLTQENLPVFVAALMNNAKVEGYYKVFEEALAAAEDEKILVLKTVVFDTDKTIDFGGKEVNSNVNPAFRITNGATVIVKNGNMNTAEGYNFILGASDSSSAGNLTIESGKFHGATTVASVTMGSLNITGGEFSVEPYQGNYAFLINCYDPNYNNGAEVSISGGTFHKWNPENNAAEGVNTNFCAQGYAANEIETGVYEVVAGMVLNQTKGIKYATLQAAIDAAENGDEIVVLKDITLGTGETREYTTTSGGTVSVRALNLISGKSVTIDLNGNTLYCEEEAEENQIYNFFAVTEEGHLTIKDSSEDGIGTVEIKNNDADATTVHSLIMCYNGTMTIENGNYKLHYGKNGNGMIYSQQSETVTVNGGNFWLGNVGTLENHSPWIFNASGRNGNRIIVNGGTFNDDVLHQYYAFEVESSVKNALVNNNNGTWSVITNGAVAHVTERYVYPANYTTNYTNTVGYATLKDAFAAAHTYNYVTEEEMSTVTMLKDVTLDAYVTISKSVNLNLDQFNITREDGTALYFNGEGIEVTINGEGTVSGTQAVYVDNGTVTINGGNYVGGYEAVYVINNGHAVIYGGTFGAENDEDDTDFVLNEYDATRDVTTIAVYGGTFHGFNPENNAAEGAGTNFCAQGYGAVETSTGSNIWEVMPVQKQSLVAGWNWYSSYLKIKSEDLLLALGTNGSAVVSDNGGGDAYYEESYGWDNSLTENLDLSKMYMIETSIACDLNLAGELADASTITITLNPGWNWIGYPSNVKTRISDAFSGFTPDNGDVIKTKANSFAEYYEGQWYDGGVDMTMEPTKGYMYYNASLDVTKTFTYNIVPVTTRGNNETAVATHYSVDYTKYPFNMTMVAVVDGAMNDNYEVAALVNGEVRGSARPVYIESMDAYMLFLSINGDAVEEMTFKYYDLTTGEEYDLVNRIDYSNNAMVGSVNEPYVLSRGTTGIGEAAMSQVNIYPNPTTTGTEINLQTVCDTVEVFNALGVKVAEYQNVDTVDALETAGIYVIRITNDGNVQNCRLVVK